MKLEVEANNKVKFAAIKHYKYKMKLIHIFKKTKVGFVNFCIQETKKQETKKSSKKQSYLLQQA